MSQQDAGSPTQTKQINSPGNGQRATGNGLICISLIVMFFLITLEEVFADIPAIKPACATCSGQWVQQTIGFNIGFNPECIGTAFVRIPVGCERCEVYVDSIIFEDECISNSPDYQMLYTQVMSMIVLSTLSNCPSYDQGNCKVVHIYTAVCWKYKTYTINIPGLPPITYEALEPCSESCCETTYMACGSLPYQRTTQNFTSYDNCAPQWGRFLKENVCYANWCDMMPNTIPRDSKISQAK